MLFFGLRLLLARTAERKVALVDQQLRELTYEEQRRRFLNRGTSVQHVNYASTDRQIKSITRRIKYLTTIKEGLVRKAHKENRNTAKVIDLAKERKQKLKKAA